jgi:serine/threonine protein kinase
VSEAGVVASRLIAGRYELDALIGKGGIAEVWRARHVALNSFVAIKFLQGGASAQNEAALRRFTTEAQVTAQLKSQHAVQVFDFGVADDGRPYLVMELLEGETLGRRLEREGRLGVLAAARILGQSARALHRAHLIGIVHRDFKPDNIVVGADDEGRDYVKVVDFGIAKLVGDLDPPTEPGPDLASTAPPTTFTKTGAMLGTPYYMAPEQIRSAADVDLRADVWAFGVVAFECLTGCTPFNGETLLELFEKIESGEHPAADKLEPSVPVGFQAWFDTACAPDPARRFHDVNTAWKKLLVALDCGTMDIEPSIKFGRVPMSSGERHVLAVPQQGGADGNAITMDAAGKKGVEPRHDRSKRKTHAGAPPDVAPPSPVVPGAIGSEPQALSHTIADDDGVKRRRMEATEDTAVVRVRPSRSTSRNNRIGAILVAVPLLAFAGVIAWRMSSPAPVSRDSSTVRTPPPEATPSTAHVEVAPASASSEIVAPPPPAASVPSARPTAPHPRPRASGAASISLANAPAASAAAHPSSPPAAPSSTPKTQVADPGSYR